MNIRPGWLIVVFACLLAISAVTHVNPAMGASAAADTTLTDTRVNRFITNTGSTVLVNPTVATVMDVGFSFPASMANMTAGGGIMLTASGSVTAGAPGMVHIAFRLGGTERITASAYIPAIMTNGTWTVRAQATIRTAGASGTIMTNIDGCMATATGSVSVSAIGARGNSITPASIDTTVANRAELSGSFGVSNASNEIKVDQMIIETLR